MEPQNNACKAAVERLLAEIETNINTDIYRYARTAAHAFEEIQSLRARGIRFEQICKLFETAGLLPENAKAHSLCQAFNREKVRRSKAGGHTAQATAKKTPVFTKAETKGTVSAAVNPTMPACVDGEEKDKADRLRRETGKVVNTGLGIIVKHTDGSFDYD